MGETAMHSNAYSGKYIALIAALALLIGTNLVRAQNDPPTEADCKDHYPFEDPANCTNYYQCLDIFGNGTWFLVNLDCPPNSHFDAPSGLCSEGPCEVPATSTASTTVTAEDSTTTELSTEATSETTSESSSESSTTATTEDTSDTSTADAGTTTEETTELSTSSTSTEDISTTETSTELSSTELPSTVGPPTFDCTAPGFFVHPTDPARYYRCILINAQFYYAIYTCPPTSCFQQSQGLCVVNSCGITPPTTKPPVTTPPVIITCNATGSFPLPGSCSKYYRCILIQESLFYYVFQCPPGSHFDVGKQLCVVGECPVTSPTTPPSDTTAPPIYPCPSQGYFADPTDCQAYYRCIIVAGQMNRYFYRCPVTAYWSSEQNGCIVGTCPVVPTTTTPNTPTGTTDDMSESATTALLSTVAITTESDSTSSTPVISTTESDSTSSTPVISTTESDSTSSTPVISTTESDSSTSESGSTTENTSESDGATEDTTPIPFSCSQAGFFTNPNNCRSYNRCMEIFGMLFYFTYTCPPATYFDVSMRLCVPGSC